MDKGLDIAAQRTLLAWHAALNQQPAAFAATARRRAHDCAGGREAWAEALAAEARRRGLAPRWAAAEAALAWLEAERHHLVVHGEPAYPPLLAEIPTPPPLLFVAGELSVLRAAQLAIVGARRATRSAREFAADLAGEVVRRGVAVGSGLALGIDGAAHRGALAAGGTTLAVLGCGIDRVYPRRHLELAASIERSGALVSEFPLGAAPLRHHFPRRNRLIAGLARATLVVEAATRSGSISTALHALEQGREVFAVPGSVHNPLAAGCHALIRQGARLTTSIEDIAEEMPDLLGAAAASGKPPAQATGARAGEPGEALPGAAREVLEACGWEPVTIDCLVHRSGLTVQEVCSMLSPLELAGLVECRANGTYVRIR